MEGYSLASYLRLRRYKFQLCPTLRTFVIRCWGYGYGYHNFPRPCALIRYSPLKKVFARTGIAAEANSRSGSVTHITEHHSLNVYGSSFIGNSPFYDKGIARSFIHTIEYGADSTPTTVRRRKVGEIFSGLFFTAALNFFTSSLRSSTSSSLSSFTPFSMFHLFYNGRTGLHLPCSPASCPALRHRTSVRNDGKESHAKRALPVLRIIPSTTSSFNQGFRIVSIMPGMEARARTDGHQQWIFHITEFGAHQRLHGRWRFQLLFNRATTLSCPIS